MGQTKIVLCDTDGFIAASALANDIELYTLNLRDYRFIDGLRLYKQ